MPRSCGDLSSDWNSFVLLRLNFPFPLGRAMATDASVTARPRGPRPSYTIGLVNPENGRTMSLRIGSSTPSSTVRDIIASRLLQARSSASNGAVTPIAIMVEDVCVPFSELYDSLAALTEEQRKAKHFEVVFSSPVLEPQPTPSSSISTNTTHTVEGNTDRETSNHPSTWTFQPIGYVKSCWQRKNGCPRQGILTPNSKATIKLEPPRVHNNSGAGARAADALEGLEAFSHVWLIFIFHANQEARESGQGVVGSGHVRAKVHPPRLGGKAIGLYATRSPHRFVPIGLTAAVLERVDGDTLHLSGVDLIDGTPVLDIKPYVPAYDSIQASHEGADWITAGSEISTVLFTDESLQHLEMLAPSCAFFNQNFEAIKMAICETLLADPRSVYRKTKCKGEPFGFRLDVLSVQCSVDNDVATVLDVVLHSSIENKSNDEDV